MEYCAVKIRAQNTNVKVQFSTAGSLEPNSNRDITMYSNSAHLAFRYLLTNRTYDSSHWYLILGHTRQLRAVGGMPYRASSNDLRMIGQGAAAKEMIENTGISRASYFSLKKVG
jgi:hypothetical protein